MCRGTFGMPDQSCRVCYECDSCIVPLKKSEGTKLTSSEGSTKLASFSMCYAAQLYGLLCILRIIWSYVNSVVFADCFICTCITQ
ncbi:hypothetical protein HanIR_Chr09g0398521 [Helianthus annuus]|nr:hypothetical protein HanIR_Chr09g0398521 [Helianthus annuus]